NDELTPELGCDARDHGRRLALAHDCAEAPGEPLQILCQLALRGLDRIDWSTPRWLARLVAPLQRAGIFDRVQHDQLCVPLVGKHGGAIERAVTARAEIGRQQDRRGQRRIPAASLAARARQWVFASDAHFQSSSRFMGSLYRNRVQKSRRDRTVTSMACCVLTKRAKFKLWIARSRCCRLRLAFPNGARTTTCAMEPRRRLRRWM